MSKDKISDYSQTANSNTDIGGINVDEGCAPSGINDAIRTLMKQLKDWQSGSQDVYIHPAGSASVPSITATGDTNTGLFFPAADTVGITTGGTERARVDSAGNMGLGVTPSAWASGGKALELPNGSSLFTYTNTSQVILTSNAYFNGTNWIYKATNAAANYEQGVGKHIWYTAPSGTAGNAITFTQAMTLDSSGNLLVGTTSSGSARLYVRGSGTTSSTASFEASNSSGATRLYVQDDGTTRFFGSSGSETARIDSSGNLLVGVTSTVNSSKMFMGFSGGRGFGINDAAGGSGTQIVWFQSAGTQVGSITTTTTATSYNTSSDYRLKNVTGSLTGYKERLSALQPKQGSWKADGSEFRGFLAHEFAVSYPTSVNGEKDAVDADGNPQYQGMQAGSSEVIADLVAYIKELETRLTALEQA